MLNEKVLDAFLSIGVPEDKARAAAVSLAEAEPRFAKIENELTAIKGEIAGIKNELSMLKWMMGVHMALTAAVLLKLLVTTS